ncbi:hypothetical protein CACET_c23050 [Clostridium aceticum]|uniref:Uncharacterized protein n=1 Tax=Clostridium aceticum TaxID=84022 RepID=A0A0D8I8V9_9CLOT|nr:hypothetical protein [Clostridium aceticum]AKL95751.1 hypothetical protein CACET_c23050 [Clostridium aceticum]KJF26703.1 hypothetical protein TZ02_10740 [Clostridium aceticum]
MRFIKQIFSVLVIVVILAGCSSNTEEKIVISEQLIYGESSEMDLVQIDYKLEGSKQWKDSLIINQLMEKLQGIELRQLPVDEEIEVFKGKEILYSISLISLQNPSHGKEAKGGTVLIFSTGEIVFPDIKTMGDGRTISYINVNEEIIKREAIISFIESL